MGAQVASQAEMEGMDLPVSMATPAAQAAGVDAAAASSAALVWSASAAVLVRLLIACQRLAQWITSLPATWASSPRSCCACKM